MISRPSTLRTWNGSSTAWAAATLFVPLDNLLHAGVYPGRVAALRGNAGLGEFGRDAGSNGCRLENLACKGYRCLGAIMTRTMKPSMSCFKSFSKPLGL